jgi:ubiquinone/menaquinone biosynthesis C-methylase UbiE
MSEVHEHLNPIGRTDYLSVQHLDRYHFAITRLRAGQRVLDIASGAGYGTGMLSRHGCHVVGGDYDAATVAAARDYWNYDDFVSADAMALPFASESFDAVVSFETIEHVPDAAAFLAEMTRVLRPGGTFICSTPNIAYSDHPPYHLKEYRPEEFFALLERGYGVVERFGQYFKPIDRTLDLYQWHVRAPLVDAAARIGIKETLKKILRGAPAANGAAARAARRAAEPERELAVASPADYRVQPCRGPKWLRIMVAVAVKGW